MGLGGLEAEKVKLQKGNATLPLRLLQSPRQRMRLRRRYRQTLPQ